MESNRIMGRNSHILTINSGSSSIKFSLYVLGETERLVLSGELGRIGVSQGFWEASDDGGQQLTAQKLNLPDSHLDQLRERYSHLS
jgi:acetate kinase